MDIGLNITKNVRIYIGAKLQDIRDNLDENEIQYKIPAVVKNKTGGYDVILYIESYGVEMGVFEDRVSYIKTNNSKLNYVMSISESSAAIALREIRQKVAERFNVPAEYIRVNKFDSHNFNSVMTVPYEGSRIKISLINGIGRGIFIESIRVV